MSEVIVEKLSGREVYVFDNDLTGWKKSLKYLEMGKKVVCWPRELDGYKDANKLLVDDGWSKEKFTRMVRENIVSGTPGLVRMKMKTINRKR